MPEVTLNGKKVEFKSGETILSLAWRNGVKLPVFCYHPHLPVFAGCRICLVEVVSKKKKMILPSCATEVQEGMVINTDTDELKKKIREGELEFMLLNHPLECPVCDAGGVCDLQNIVHRFGRTESRYQFQKRRKKKVKLGAFLELYPNRCIVCYRCVNFYREIVGGDDFVMLNRGGEQYPAPANEKILESEFSGNMIDICPLGAITGRDLRFSSRPWENNSIPSVAPTDSTGVSINIVVRSGKKGDIADFRKETHNIVQILPRVNEGVHSQWLDDRARFAKDFVNSPDRIKKALIGKDEVSIDDAIGYTVERMKRLIEESGSEVIAGLASGRGTNESAFLFSKFIRDIVGTANIDSRPYISTILDRDPIVEIMGVSASSDRIEELTSKDTVVVWGTNIRDTHPVLSLNLMEAKRRGKRVISFYYLGDKSISRWATDTVTSTPGEINSIAFDILQAIESKASPPDKIGKRDIVIELVEDLKSAKECMFLFPDDLHPIAQRIFSYLSTVVKKLSFIVLRTHPNGQGFIDMGVHPELYPGQKLSIRGFNTREIIEGCSSGKIKGVILYDVDPFVEFPNRNLVDSAFGNELFVVYIGSFQSPIMERADVVLPLAVPFEEKGSVTTTEGRVMWSEKVVPPLADSKEGYRLFGELIGLMGGEEYPGEAGELFDIIKKEVPDYSKLELPLCEVKQKEFPDYIPSLSLIKNSYRFPAVDYKFEPMFIEIKLDSRRKENSYKFLLFVTPNIYREHYSRRSRLTKDLAPEGIVEMNPSDIEKLGIKDKVIIENEVDKLRVRVVSNKDIVEGTIRAFSPFYDLPLNKLLDDYIDAKVNLTIEK